MTMARVGARYQVVIPRRERGLVGLKPGQQVRVTAERGVVVVQPATPAGLRGLGKKVRDGQDATDYIRKLRAEWGRSR